LNICFLFDRFLTVAEQLVTYHESRDMTEILNNNSYWASYNNIYFPDFRNISGEEAMAKKKGPELLRAYQE
jgi:Phospholipase B